MIRKTWWAIGGGLASTLVLAGAWAVAHAQQKAEPPRKVDRAKNDIEIGAKNVVAAPPVVPAAAPNPRDFAKGRVERPTEDVLARAAAQALRAQAEKAFVNPKVAPGKVSWHADLATACAAAKTSGKPVLLFQMMGKLDDQFC
jgi:hypothetical protein